MNNVFEQKEFIDFLGYFPTPRNKEEEELFDKGLINRDGFISVEKRKEVSKYMKKYKATKFQEDPSSLICRLYAELNPVHFITS